jgi:hypothetical protein
MAYFEALRHTDPQLADLVTEGLSRARRVTTKQKLSRDDLFRQAYG